MQKPIPQPTRDTTINIALDTLEKKKQALIFVNSKRAAERQAEDLSKKTRLSSQELTLLAEELESVLDKPTHQCSRLAACVRKGVAFHHAGLASKQKELIETHFKKGSVKVICCTPTLAYGLDLPAFRSIVRDVKRYGHRGMDFIPVLEYLQMAGRAGRPKFDAWGEAILLADTETEVDDLLDRYIRGEPEEIYSKLAVEPVLRTYLLSLIAARFVRTREEILDFFGKTFWAHQFGDMEKLGSIIDKMLRLLTEWEFIQSNKDEFAPASEIGNVPYRASFLGQRVAELYLDPLTAHQVRKAVSKADVEKPQGIFPWLHILSRQLEMRPLSGIRQKEYEVVSQRLALSGDSLHEREPSMFDQEYDAYLDAVKMAMILDDWCEEKDEEFILETYNIRPGELRAKLSRLDWLLYATHELAHILQCQDVLSSIRKVRTRAKYGIKEELVALVRLDGIGRSRARMLFRNGIKDLGDIKKADIQRLISILGNKLAASVKRQAGESVQVVEDVPFKRFERKG